MTGTITLRTAFANYPHVRAIKDGSVASARIRFDFEDVPVITRAFRRMVRTLDFDLCEIALTTLAQAHAFGKPIKALPIVVMRGFHHGALVCPVGSAIHGPADLRGKRIGVRAWSQTTGDLGAGHSAGRVWRRSPRHHLGDRGRCARARNTWTRRMCDGSALGRI